MVRRRLTMTRLPLVVLLCILYPIFEKGLCIDKILGDPFEFSATKNCTKRGGKLVHLLENDSTRLVAHWDGVWNPEPDYEDRMSPKYSVILKRININDNGLYELTCNGEDETRIKLNVVKASEVSVTEGGSVRFPFYYVTIGKHGKRRLEKNGELVSELDLSSGVIRYGTGFEERVSVLSDWKSLGDLTLNLKRVMPEDQGDYFSYFEGEVGKRLKENLIAVRIKVNKRNLDQITYKPPPACRATVERGTLTTVTAAVIAHSAFWFD